MPDFDVRSLLGRQWLESAMRTWEKRRYVPHPHETVLPLVRWLGADAEILEPSSLRERLRSELDTIRQSYG